VWSDPLAGLVTGVDAGSPAPLTVPVGKPTMPDMDEVRRAVDAALLEEEQLKSGLPKPRSDDDRVAAGPAPGIMSNPRPGWPRPPLVRQLRVRLRPAAGRRPAHAILKPRRTGPSQNAMGIGVVIALLVVAIVLVMVIIFSLIDTFHDILS
jgi:hypothetical protein